MKSFFILSLVFLCAFQAACLVTTSQLVLDIILDSVADVIPVNTQQSTPVTTQIWGPNCGFYLVDPWSVDSTKVYSYNTWNFVTCKSTCFSKGEDAYNPLTSNLILTPPQYSMASGMYYQKQAYYYFAPKSGSFSSTCSKAKYQSCADLITSADVEKDWRTGSTDGPNKFKTCIASKCSTYSYNWKRTSQDICGGETRIRPVFVDACRGTSEADFNYYFARYLSDPTRCDYTGVFSY